MVIRLVLVVRLIIVLRVMRFLAVWVGGSNCISTDIIPRLIIRMLVGDGVDVGDQIGCNG